MKFFRLKLLVWVFASVTVFLFACEKKVEEKAERNVVRPIKMEQGQDALKAAREVVGQTAIPLLGMLPLLQPFS